MEKLTENDYEILDACCELQSMKIKELKAENAKLKARLRPFEDSYFKGLSPVEISGLAKKSIRITAYNRQLENCLAEIKEIAENREIFCENCSFCCDEFTCDDCGYVKILQKLTKAEEE